MTDFLSRAGEKIVGRHVFPWFITALLAALLGLRVFLFPGMGGDDGEQLVFSQFFDWGYQLRNPPLYTWLVMITSSIVGPSALAVGLVKFPLLAATYLLLWRCALIVLDDKCLAAAAALMPLALYYVAWDSIHGYSHSVLAMFLYVAALFLVLRIEKQGRTRDFVLLGLVIGAGLLAKYVFALFVVALLGAAVMTPPMRQRLMSWRLLLTLACAIAVALPHFLWLFQGVGNALIVPPEIEPADYALGAVKGIGRLMAAIIGFLAPLIVFALLVFPRAFAPLGPRSTHPHMAWLSRYFVVLFTVAVIALLFPHVDRLRTHYMFVLIPFPIYLAMRVRAAGYDALRIGRFSGFLAVLGVLIPIAMIGKFVLEPLKCERCQHHIPYADLATALRATGFQDGTIFAYWHPDPIAGNLRAQFPKARVISAKHPSVQPPPKEAVGQCLLVWPVTEKDIGRSATVNQAKRLFGADIPADVPHYRVSAPLVMGYGRKSSLGYIFIDEGTGPCR